MFSVSACFMMVAVPAAATDIQFAVGIVGAAIPYIMGYCFAMLAIQGR